MRRAVSTSGKSWRSCAASKAGGVVSTLAAPMLQGVSARAAGGIAATRSIATASAIPLLMCIPPPAAYHSAASCGSAPIRMMPTFPSPSSLSTRQTTRSGTPTGSLSISSRASARRSDPRTSRARPSCWAASRTHRQASHALLYGEGHVAADPPRRRGRPQGEVRPSTRHSSRHHSVPDKAGLEETHRRCVACR